MQQIDFDVLMDDGLVFMWAVNSKVDDAVAFMKQRGWKRKETFRWMKCTRQGTEARRGGDGVWHVAEDCLMFKRVEALDKADKFMVKKAVSNAIVSNVSGTSIKPFQMYEKIEALVPAGPYLELFGRVHNRRQRWVTAGNEAIEYRSSDQLADFSQSSEKAGREG